MSNLERIDNSGRPTYVPLIQFKDFGLIVTFDHSLRAEPEDLEGFNFRGAQTAFVIAPERELYAGLHFVSPATLRVVSEGLRSYLDGDLKPEQKGLVELGVRKLEEFLGRRT